MSQSPATMEMPSIDEDRPSAAGAVFKRRAPRSRRKKRHNMKKDVSWRDLKGLTFEEIECLEAEEARTRAAAQQLDSFGEAAASTPKTKSDAEAYLDEFEGGGGGEPREETWSEDDDDDYSSSESDDDDDGDDDHDASRHTAGEWWSVAIGGIANKLGGVVQSVKKAAKDAVKERGEQWISTLLDNFFNQQRRNNTFDPQMPEWIRWRMQLVWDNIIPDVKLEIMHLLTNIESRIGLVAVRRGSALAAKLDEEMDLMPHGFWARKRAFLLYKMSPYDRSFWTRMRDPWHWIITVFKALPATQAFSFTLYLCLIDKKDDFQLNEFIMQAKGFQFLTSGCFTMIMYSLRLAACTVLVSPNSATECQTIYKGSINSVIGFFGVEAPWLIDLASYVWTIAANISLSWIALSLMDKSVPKGAEQRREKDLIGQAPKNVLGAMSSAATMVTEAASTAVDIATKSGKRWGTHKGTVVAYDEKEDFHTIEVEVGDGLTVTRAVMLHKLPYIMLRPFGKNHLKNLLYWDGACAIICAVLIVGAFVCLHVGSPLSPGGGEGSLETWQVMAGLFWFRCLYSITTVPFLLARIPVVDKILGHHRPTAYTRYGKCVPKRKLWPWYPMPPEERARASSGADSAAAAADAAGSPSKGLA
ncbi:hypothetical protein SO694_00048160 [Aureococcus anophagefferens]|uniref:Uncharacterized protein n=1 Tax=Aureococcus anophagefferens TaxID=44056 RepID=A0ABR1G889_AURAN